VVEKEKDSYINQGTKNIAKPEELNFEELKNNNFKWTRKTLLSTKDLHVDEVEAIFHTAESLSEILTRKVKKVPALRGKVVINLFYEESTRTRSSFELAGKYLSSDVTNFSISTSSVKKGETLQDTAQTLIQMGADAVVIRHNVSGVPFQLAEYLPRNISIINAGDGSNEHPTQALLDLFTIRKHVPSLKNKKVVIVGDILHSRVARSNIWLLQKFGTDIHVCGPPPLLPESFKNYGVKVHWKLDDAIKDADVIMTLRLQRERQTTGLIPQLDEYHRLYCLSHERLKLAKKNVKILHPGPINRGVEITSELADDTNYSLISDQVSNGVSIRMALLYLLIFASVDS